jgi:chemotaxis protein MotB
MAFTLKRNALLFPLMAPVLLPACVSESRYDALVVQNQQLQQQIADAQAHINRLQGAIKYTVNSNLLFPSGSWQMTADGQDIIAKMAKTLAAGPQAKLMVNGYTDNTPIGPELKRQGITSNKVLSQKRAENVMQYMISQGVKPNLIAAQGFGAAHTVAPNDTGVGRAQNRRVEVTFAGPGS